MNRAKKLAIATGVVAGIAAGAAGVAYAVWSASGTGSGGAAATVAQGVTVTAITPTGAAASLYPGSPPSSVYFTVSNPNPYAITITSIAWGTPTSANPTACPNANISVDTNAPKTGLSISVPAASTSSAISVPNVLDLAHSAPDGCQGVSFFVGMTVTGTQQ